MKIDWLEFEKRDHVLSWFLLEAVSRAGIEKLGDFDSSELEVNLTINGVEVPIIEPMEFLQSQLKDVAENGNKKAVETFKWQALDAIEAAFTRNFEE